MPQALSNSSVVATFTKGDGLHSPKKRRTLLPHGPLRKSIDLLVIRAQRYPTQGFSYLTQAPITPLKLTYLKAYGNPKTDGG